MKNYFITLGRQYGSGGHEIAKRVAAELRIKFYDTELIDKAAKNASVSKSEYEQHDEVLPNQNLFGRIKSVLFSKYHNETLEIAEAQFEAIRDIYKGNNSAVIVGRCSDYVLGNEDNVFKVFVFADLEHKKQRISEKKNITLDEAEQLVVQVDKQRAAYYNFHTFQNWGSVDNYDLCINSGKYSIDHIVEFIVESVHALGLDED